MKQLSLNSRQIIVQMMKSRRFEEPGSTRRIPEVTVSLLCVPQPTTLWLCFQLHSAWSDLDALTVAPKPSPQPSRPPRPQDDQM